MQRLPERCERHDLAVRPDGTCLLCAGGVTEEETPPPPSRWWRALQYTVGALLITLGVTLGYRLTEPVLDHALNKAVDTPDHAKWQDEDPKPVSIARTEPTASDLRAARRRVHVTLYTTTDCSYCLRARHYMRARTISFVEHDIEADEQAAEALRRINPRASVPTIDVDGTVMTEFNEGRLNALIDQAARQRI